MHNAPVVDRVWTVPAKHAVNTGSSSPSLPMSCIGHTQLGSADQTADTVQTDGQSLPWSSPLRASVSGKETTHNDSFTIPPNTVYAEFTCCNFLLTRQLYHSLLGNTYTGTCTHARTHAHTPPTPNTPCILLHCML